jgi:hypothetical protein
VARHRCRAGVETETEMAGVPEPAQAADWPRLAGAWGSLRRGLALSVGRQPA